MKDCQKDCPHRLQLEELTSILGVLVELIDKISLSDLLCLEAALAGLGHADLVGWVRVFMVNAMNTSMGDD